MEAVVRDMIAYDRGGRLYGTEIQETTGTAEKTVHLPVTVMKYLRTYGG